MGRPPRETRPPYGEWLFALRTRKNLSLTALSLETGISIQTLSSWEKRGMIENRDRILLLAKALGVSVGTLLGEEPSTPKTLSEKVAIAKHKRETLKIPENLPNPAKDGSLEGF